MTPHERIHDPATCVQCSQVREKRELDRMLWCESCRLVARRQAGRWGWGGGALVAAGLAAWIWVVIEPSDLVLGGWIATVVAAFYLCGRIFREIAYGIVRYRGR